MLVHAGGYGGTGIVATKKYCLVESDLVHEVVKAPA